MDYLRLVSIFLALSVPITAQAQMDTRLIQDTVAVLATELGMTEIEARDKGHNYGANILGRLPDGMPLAVETDLNGAIEEIETDARGGFPASAIESLLPVEVLGSAAYPTDAMFQKVELDHDKVKIEGWDAAGRQFDSEFGYDGRLIEMDYDD